MCLHHAKILRLLEQAEKMRPTGEGGEREKGWYLGTINGLKLALREVMCD